MSEGQTRTPEARQADTHLTVVAALNFVWAGMLGLAAFASWWALQFAGWHGGYWSGQWWIPDTMGSIAVLVVGVLLLLALPSLLAGIGLASRKEWGRVLGLVVAGLAAVAGFLTFNPLALGFAVYSFWALTRPEVAAALGP